MSIGRPSSRSTAIERSERDAVARSAPQWRSASAVIALLVTGLSLLAAAPFALPDSYGYSWVEQGTSESAAQGIDGAWVARLGFLTLGLAVLLLASLRARAWRPVGTVLHLAFGTGMIAGAAYSTKPWWEGAAYVESEDLLHSVCATVVGIGFVGGVLAVMVARRLPSAAAATPDLLAIAITTTMPLMMSAGIWGVLQRMMFLTAAIWYGREAWSAHSTGRPST